MVNPIVWLIGGILFVTMGCDGQDKSANGQEQSFHDASDATSPSDTASSEDADSAASEASDGVDDNASTSEPDEDETSEDTASTGDVNGFANVIDVSITGSENDYNFDVTLETSDIDCSHFADWWEVLTPEGALLYRRILRHPHTEAISGNPFTRGGGPVEIGATQEVIVRAHLNNMGYVGSAMRGSAEGDFEVESQLSSDFAVDVETEEPQPVECVSE